MNDKNQHSNSLITEREIDPSFGLFAEERVADEVKDAETELTAVYPEGDAICDNHPGAEQAAEAEAAQNTPIDPAAPEQAYPGVDLINGVGAEPEKETE
ncbi:hypothetical protein PA598K_05056 [Paenibacillus sp. 598K]|uniref:hypothetical protein n=1 Tax=Paenibacillus sp. 598K TaxID=1117987 RepID=UPI000FFADB46|nr:hypothetical protein [Paenibacillus sp. 598K]GBF76578.1 hypothetical protein PA598K_05056 [Paenibacillus sp. 598K]